MPSPANRESSETIPVVVVVLGGREHAIPSSAVEAILPRPRFVPVAGAAAWLAGLMDHRGSLVPVVDGAALLGAGSAPMRIGARVVLLQIPAARADGSVGVSRFGLMCDRVCSCESLSVGADAWRPGSDAVPLPFSVIGRIGAAAIPLLDPARLVATEPLLAPAPAALALAREPRS
ncbi:MAG: chemotaxis protein CheW [Phycisphaerae bacterium]|nr:chemotaxis protein CheW [Phycisphaerae bacterium]